jgi:PKD repeat protein
MKSVGERTSAFGRTLSWLLVSSAFLSSLPVLSAPIVPLPGGAFTIPGIKRFTRTDVDPGRLLAQVGTLQTGSFALDLGQGNRWNLDLERVSNRAPGYRVRLLTPQGLQDVAPVPEQSFRGRIHGNPASKVRLSFSGGRVTGFIDAGDGQRTFVEPLDVLDDRMPGGSHAIYRQSDMELPKAMAVCAWTPDGSAPDLRNILPPGLNPFQPGLNPSNLPTVPTTLPPTAPGLLKSSAITAPSASASGAAAAAEACGLVEIAIAAEYSMVKGWKTTAAVEKRINDIFTMVEGLYEDERINIHIKITEMIIESGPNLTWGAMNINTYLTNITPWARGAQGFKSPYDVVGLWYYDPLVSSGTTGLAYVGTVCNKTSGGHVIRDFTSSASFLMVNQAHELGHNFGANHVNNTQSLLNPTILGNNTAWDDITIASIVNHKRSRTCLSSCNQGPDANFVVKAKSPCSDTREFTDASKGVPTSWSWNFGDGTSSSVQNPTHVYAGGGTYTARLTAVNAVGSDTVTKGGIVVKPYAPPTVTGARSCVPAALTLSAAGTGTLKWYDEPAGGNKVGEGPAFLTPTLSASRMYYAETGDADRPLTKVGPASNAIGVGQYFVANAERRMYFDVARPAVLRTVKVFAGSAGPRTIEILDQSDVRVAVKTVPVPAGESRIALNFDLEPGHDYAIKYSGRPDSLNLFRNSAGASYPYRSPDSLFVITHSDAVTSDAEQSGYYYYFYDWEVQERVCGSTRVPVAAEISCVPIAEAAQSGSALSNLGGGRFRFAGFAPASQQVEFRVLSLDGVEARRQSARTPQGAFSVELDLAGLPANLYLLEVKQGGLRTLVKWIGF